MLEPYRIYIYMLAAGAAVLTAVFSVPALTTPEAAGTRASPAEMRAVMAREQAFCERQPGNLDCACFAGVAGTILLDQTPRVAGARYADKQDLARGQAARKC